MSGKFKTLLLGRRVVPWAGCIAATVCLVFLFVLGPAAGAENTVWTKYNNSIPAASDLPALNGRIPLGTTGKGDDDVAWRASVIKDGALYKMWYTGHDGANYRIYYATSPDGLNWAKYDNNVPDDSNSICTNGTIALGSAGKGDSSGVYAPAVIKDGSTYKMWYAGMDDGNTNRIYYASSLDGLTWTKKNNAIHADSDTTSDDGRIPLGTGGKGDVGNSGYPAVILEGSTYKMWYGGHDGSKWRIYHATSSDGLNWTKYSNSVPDDSNTTGTEGRIPHGTSGGDDNFIRSCNVILDDSIYRMWYAANGGGKSCIYNATSIDGLTWTKVTNALPGNSDTISTLGRIPLGESGSGDDSVANVPTVIKDGDTYKMWYGGKDGSKYRIYHATSTDSLTWTKVDNTEPGNSDTPVGRIPLGTDGQGDDAYVMYPAVIQDGSTYKMWYSGRDGNKWRIYYATSPDGLVWAKYDNNTPGDSDSICTNGTIAIGLAGTGDEGGAMDPSVIKDDSTYKMWYNGRDSGNTGRIYYATSSNGLTWIKYTNAIPDPSNTTGTDGRIPLGTSGGDSSTIYGPSVIKDGSIYKMWYGGSDGTNNRIYHATSSNGLTWTKYTNAVPGNTNTTSTLGRIPLGTSEKGDERSASYPTVIKVRSTYKMWYSGQDDTGGKYRIYYATSTDGLTWTKYDNSIPTDSDTTSTNGCIPLGDTGGDTDHVYAPCVIKEGLIQEGYKYKIWYAGLGDKYRIYYATCDQPPKACTIFYSY